MTETNELEALIKEQERESRWGDKIYHEPFVALSLDGPAGENHIVSDFVSDSGVSYLYRGKVNGCAEHGLGAMRSRSNGKIYCQTCHQRSKRMKYRTDPAFRARQLSREAERYRTDTLWREAKKAKNLARYHANALDPEWKERENDRQRRARARKKYGL